MWDRIKTFFRDSETIFWARLQVLLGGLALVVTYVDPSVLAPVMPADWMPWAIVLNGVGTEYLRRRRES